MGEPKSGDLVKLKCERIMISRFSGRSYPYQKGQPFYIYGIDRDCKDIYLTFPKSAGGEFNIEAEDFYTYFEIVGLKKPKLTIKELLSDGDDDNV